MPFLEEWTGQIPVFILSNIDSEDLIAAIEYHSLKVGGVITSEEVRSYKPRKEMFLEGLHRTGLKPDEVLHIGDSIVNDVYGAMQYGLDAVWLNRAGKDNQKSIHPTYIYSDLNAVTEMMKSQISSKIGKC